MTKLLLFYIIERKKGVIMDLLELLKKRYSVRKFDGRTVEKEKLDLILQAGRVAPTAVNFQPQRVLVIESEEALEKLKAALRIILMRLLRF